MNQNIELEQTEAVYIVLATDENYTQHAGITLLSLLKNSVSSQAIEIIVLTDAISQRSEERLRSVAKEWGAKLSFVEVDLSCVKGWFMAKHLSKMSFARLLLPDLLPDNIEKVLYVDTDVIVRQDIAALWSFDISDYAVGAVEEVGFFHKHDYKKAINLPLDAHYFNSGVLLINLKMWRADGITEKIFTYLDENPNALKADQDALNVVFADRWLSLPPKWNVHKDTYTHYYSLSFSRFTDDLLSAIKNPGIMHFTGPRKPWHYASAVPFSGEYMEYIDDSPWKGYRYPDVNLKSGWHRFRWLWRLKVFGAMRRLFGQ